jgi:hypothetical protein
MKIIMVDFDARDHIFFRTDEVGRHLLFTELGEVGGVGGVVAADDNREVGGGVEHA